VVSVSGEGLISRSAPVQIRAESETTIELGAPAVIVRTPPPSAPTEKPRSRKGLWIGIGVGAAVMVVGAVALGVALGTSSDGTNYWAAAQKSCTGNCVIGDFR
jgi:hypothetical protein